MGEKLQIVVENQGRINFGTPNDFKGLVGDVFINTQKVLNWTMTGIPLDNIKEISEYVSQKLQLDSRYPLKRGRFNQGTPLRHGPMLLFGTFDIARIDILDTYLNPSGWGKGVVYVNGFNLGRYWPRVGPQITLYVPRHILKSTNNVLILVEYQTVKVPFMTVGFDSSPKFN